MGNLYSNSQGCKQQRLLAQRLHQKAGVREGLCGLPEVAKSQNAIEVTKSSSPISSEELRHGWVHTEGNNILQ